jgi:hypothetical protein
MQLKMSSALTPTLSPGRGSLLRAHWIQSPFRGCRMTDEMFSLSPGERVGVRAEFPFDCMETAE